MLCEVELNSLVSNVLSEKRYSHCRLCLKKIEQYYARFEDMVSLETGGRDGTKDSETFRPLSEIITKLLGSEICVEIPGLDAVCPECVNKILELNRFLDLCHNSTSLLNKVFSHLEDTLNVEIQVDDSKAHSLCVTLEECSSKLLVINHPQRQIPVAKDSIECELCCLEFDSAKDLVDHNLNCHGISTCDKCHKTFTDIEELAQHVTTKHKFKCPDCNQYRSTVERLKEHQDRAHKINVCKDCGKTYRGLDTLHQHEEKHINKSECPKCGKFYHTKSFYLKHVELCMAGLIDPHPIRSEIKKPYSCKECGKSYCTPGGLRVHDRFVHGNAKPHVCKFCNKAFTAPSYLKVHMVKHTGEKNFVCAICGNKFVSKEALLYHTRRHTGEKPYSCKFCDERFVNASARAEHIKFKHSKPSLMCHICSRKFVTASFLRQHMNRHNDPFSKLYTGRQMIPPNMPGEQNMRIKVEKVKEDNIY